MQIAIDIDENLYTRLFDNGDIDIAEMLKACVAIRKGIPIPKGHGKIIDTDKIEWYGCTTEADCPHKDRACKDCSRAECSKTQVDDIQPIIDADRAESEEI